MAIFCLCRVGNALWDLVYFSKKTLDFNDIGDIRAGRC